MASPEPPVVLNVLLEGVTRQLQEGTRESRGRTVLMILYLCVLGMCFVTPLFYYFRLRCEDRHSQRLGELEAAGIATAMEQSQRDETRAERRKYIEERRARIVQLFAPVRMVSLCIATYSLSSYRKLTDAKSLNFCSRCSDLDG